MSKNALLVRLLSAFVLFFAFNNAVKAQSFKTVTFTGNLSDFAVAERFAAAANNTTFAMAFDATYIYFGAFRTSGNFGSTDNFSVYIDADPRNTLTSGNGTTAGRTYNSFTPTLPFNADFTSITEQSYTDPINRFNGTWASTGVVPTVFTSSTAREVRIAKADLGGPASIYVTMWMGYSGGIFSNAPGTSNEGTAATRTMTGFFGSFPVYKAGIQPVSFRTQNTTAANGGGTAISNLSVTANTTTGGDYGDVNVSAGSIWTLNAVSSFSGTLTLASGGANRVNLVSNSFSLNIGGRGIGGSAGTITQNGTSGNPIYSGTTSGGGLNYLGAGLFNGTGTRMIGNTAATVNVAIGGTVDFTGGTGTTTLFNGGGLQINSGGAMSNPLTFQTGYALVYNTGGTYTASNEWTTNATTLIPTTVTIQNNTALNFGASAAYRQANGLITIGSGSSLTLSSAAGGDLRIAAGLTNSNTGAGVGINTNGRAVFVQGTGTYTKTGTDNLDFLIFGAANTLTLATGTNLNLTNTLAAGALQYNAAGSIFMAGTNTVTLASGTTVGGTTAGSIGGTTPTTSILSLAGTATVNTGGLLTVSTNVGIQVNAGLTITTAGRLSAGYLQINPGGFIGGTNPVVYPASSTLVYNHNTGVYGVQALEWPATSGPTNVTVNANGGTGISFGNNNITARSLTGTLTVAAGQNVSLTGSGTPNLTVLNTIAGAGATISGTGNYTHSASGTFTTANTGGINGTLTTSGTITLPTTTSFVFNNATASQVTGTLLPATINNLTINNPTAATGTTISNNTLVISGTTTLTAGALVLPTGVSNLVTFTGAIGGTTGTLTGSTTSNIVTSTLTSPFNLAFTSGGQALNNWNKGSSTFGSSTPQGLSTPVTISGTFTQAGAGDFYTTSAGSITILSGGTYDQQANGWYLGAGAITISSGATFRINDVGGLNATSTTAGAVRTTGTRTFNGGANYLFNSASAQAIGDALDATGGTGKTGVITGTITNANTNTVSGLTLNAGTTITVNTPGAFNVGVNAATSSILTAPATSIINGTGNVNMFGNGATSGSTLITANANGVNGTIQVSGTTSLTNGANNNTNFTFNGSVAQTTGALLPAVINNLSISNTLASATPTADVTLSSSVTANGAFTNSGRLGVGANTLTLNGAATFSTNKLAVASTSNLIIGGTGAITGASPFTTGGVTLNNFTMNRSGQVFTVNSAMTTSGTFTLTSGTVSMGAGLILNGNISFGGGTITGGTNPLTIGGTGTITGSILGTATPLALSAITINRSAATLTLGMNVTVSNAAGLTLTAGNIALGSFNLTNTNTAGNLGTGSSSSMIVATGTGLAITSYPIGATTSRTFPIGDGTNYTPVTLAFSANSVTGTVGARVTASDHPQLNLTGSPQADYINRYWSFTTSGLTNYTYSSTFTYVPGDIVGTEGNMKLNRYTGSAWVEDATSSAASNVLTSTTGLTQATGLLNGNDYTGRKEPSAVSYTWVGGTTGVETDYNTAANWSPTGVPSSTDNVTINTNTYSCIISSGSFSVTDFTLNGTGDFQMASGTTFNTSGTVTYGGTATASLNCGSTFNYTGSTSQTVAALNYGNLNLTGGARVLANTGTIGVCGTFTQGAGSFTTTGSTIDFNGTGAQTIPAFSYNNLTSSSTGARTLASSGTITVAGTFTPGSNTYTVTGSTVVLTSTTGFSFANLPTVASGNSFNILTINGTGGVFNLPYSASTQNLATTVNVTAGTLVLNPSTSTLPNTIGVGTININGGTLDDRAGVIGLSTILQVNSTWNHTSGSVTNTSASGTDRIVFTGGGATSFTGLTTSSFQYFTVRVSNNTTTTLLTNLTVNGISGNQLTVDAGSTLNAAGFIVNTDATGNNVVINGTFRTSLVAGFSGGASTAISNTFTPTITLGSTSTIEYAATGASPIITARADYANVTISGSSTTFTFGGTSTLSGNYTQSAGTVALTSTSTAYNLNVGGNFVMTGGTFNLLTNTTATSATTVTVTGNTTTSGTSSINLESVDNTNSNGIGIFQTKDFTTTSTSASIVNFGATTVTNNEFRVSGNFSKSGTGTFNTSSTTTANGFIFNKSGTQTFSYAGANSQYTQYVVNTGSTLQMLTGLTMGSGTNPTSRVTVNGTLDVSTFVIAGTTNPTFTLAAGATLITANTGGITSSITTPGTNVYNAAANYVFNGSAAQNTNFPAAVTTVNNLTINNSAANVSINKSVTVNGDLTFTSGNLDLNGSFNITLGASSSIVTESNTSRLINSGTPTAGNGYIGTVRTLAANPGNVANIGIDITTASAMGSTNIKRFPKAINTVGTGNSISRHYSIQPTAAGTSATVVLSYFDGELNSNTETSPSLAQYSSTTQSTGYAILGSTAADATANTVTFSPASISTNNTFYTLANSGLYYTQTAGDITTGTTWVGNTVPPSTGNVSILHNTTMGAAFTANNVSLASGITLSIGSNTLTIDGAVTGTGTLTGSNSSNLTVNGAAGTLLFTSGSTNNYLKNFNIGASGSATLGNALNITGGASANNEGTLTVSTTSGVGLTTGGFLTIKSNSFGTARIAAGNTSGGYISGNVTVERFINQYGNKAWRLLASNTSGQTINQAWQEGAADNTVDPAPGFGTVITSSGASTTAVRANGFDTLSQGISILKYTNSNDGFPGLTNTNIQLANEPGYFLFVRGDRSNNGYVNTNYNNVTAPLTSTVLRSKGTLFLGDQSAVNVGAGGYSLLRNPYPSRIDLRNVQLSGAITDAFDVWDPQLSDGGFGVGGFQTFTKSGSDYVVSPGGGSYGANGSVNNFVESGMAFYIKGSTSGSAQVTEACKATGSSVVNRPANPTANNARLLFNLKANTTGNNSILDGGFFDFDNANSNAVDYNDVRKNLNFTTNFGIATANTYDLIVERRAMPVATDTLFFKMDGLSARAYQLNFTPENLLTTGLVAILEDTYLNTSTPVSLLNNSTFNFDVTNVAASAAAKRFRIVFKPQAPLPVSINNISAYQQSSNIVVEWKVSNQLNVNNYEIQKSTDGRTFVSIGNQLATGNSQTDITYNFVDVNVVSGANYYRIKSVDNNGAYKYTIVVRVIIGKFAPSVTVSPNPVRDNNVNIQFVNEAAGTYQVRIVNSIGQIVMSKQLVHIGGSATQKLVLPGNLINGVYQLQVIEPNQQQQVQKLIINTTN